MKAGLIYLFSNILNAIIPFLLLPILTRYLTPAEYGQIAIFNALIAGISTFIGFNTTGAMVRKYYDGTINETIIREFNGSCFQILAISSIIVFLFIAIFEKQISNFLVIPTAWIFTSVGISALVFITTSRFTQWQVRGQAKLFGVLQVFSSIINMLLSLLLVIVFTKGAQGRIDAQIITAIITALIALVWLYKDRLLIIFSWNPAYIKEALKFGIPLIPHHIGFFLINAVDRFVINDKLGLTQAGIYLVAVQLSSAISIIFDAINKAYVPWLFELLKRNNLQEKNKVANFTYLFFIIVLLISVLSFFIGPFFITLIMDEKYKAASEIIGWLCLGQAFGGMYLMVTNYIFYAKKTGHLALVTISSGFINLLLLFMFINKLGLVGAAISFAIAKCIQFLMTFLLIIKLKNFK